MTADLRQRIAEALDNAHQTHPCTCGNKYYSSCFHTGAISHTERRTDAVLAVVQPELDQLRAELDRTHAELAGAKAEGMRDAAAMLRRYCPDHGPDEQATAFMDCHCPAATEIERDAAAPTD